jgi:hypothetical protein
MGQTSSQNFTAAGSGNAFGISPGNSLTYSVSGTYTGSMVFERSRNEGQSWEPVQAGTSGQAFSGTASNEGTATLRFRWRSSVATGTAATTIADVNNVVRRITNREGADRIVVSDDGVDLVGDVTVNGGEIGSGSGNLTVEGTPSAGQVVKWSGSVAQWDSDLTTGGTGVLITGTATPPASGTGANGDFYLHAASGLIWGPKASGAWPAHPMRYASHNGVPGSSFNIPLNTAASSTWLQAALDAAGFLTMRPGNVESPAGMNINGNSTTLRIVQPHYIPKFGALLGRNYKILAEAWAGGDFKAMLSWKAPLAFSSSIAGFQNFEKAYIEGVTVDGFRHANDPARNPNNDYIIGYDFGGIDVNGLRGNTHATFRGKDLGAQNCYIGFLLDAIQYSQHDYYKAGNCHAGFVHRGSLAGGGNVDAWALTHHTAITTGCGHLVITNGFGPWGAYSIRGVGVKQSACGFAFVQDPNATVSDASNWYSMHISDFSIEFNGGQSEYQPDKWTNKAPAPLVYYKGAGTEGEDAFHSTIIPRNGFQEAGLEGTTFSVDVYHVEVYIQRNFTAYFYNGEFNSNDTKIVALCKEKGAVVSFEHCMIPEGVGAFGRLYGVRAKDVDAGCELVDLISLGGTFENVRKWPSFLRDPRGALTNVNTGSYNLLCGWGTSEAVARAEDWYSRLSSNFNTLQPDFSESTGNVTTSIVADPTLLSGNVTRIRFPATTLSNTRAATKFLNGWGSSTSYTVRDWSVTGIELYNDSDNPVRLIGYIGGASNDHLVGQNPAWKGDLVPIAFTLWPRRWMRVAIQWGRAHDGRLCFDILSPLDTQVDILARKLMHYKVPMQDRQTLSAIMQRGLWVAP